ncbi:MAG: DUF1272 domain-containing protein [Hellea sp.]
MLEMRPNCEICDKDLPADENGAFSCSLECTFCASCNDTKLKNICPNCGGQLTARPTRSGKWLEKYPASTTRVLKT